MTTDPKRRAEYNVGISSLVREALRSLPAQDGGRFVIRPTRPGYVIVERRSGHVVGSYKTELGAKRRLQKLNGKRGE